MRSAIAVLVVLVTTVSAFAGPAIHEIAPASVPVRSGEQFVRITGADLASAVIFDGPAGRVEIKAQYPIWSDVLYVWVPPNVVDTEGVYSVFVRGEQGESNAVRFEVTPAEPIPFALRVHDPIVAEAETRDGAVVPYEIIPFGGKDANADVHCDHPSGSLFPIGTNPVFCTADNRFGEHAEVRFRVMVYDTTVPALHLPSRIVVKAENDDGSVVDYEATAHDAIDGDLPIDCKPPSGSRFPIGVTNVLCSARDHSSNLAEASFPVEVRREEEHGELTIHVPDDIVAEATSGAGASVTFTVTASDSSATIVCDPASGSTFPLGTTTVSCTATDNFGQHASDSFRVTVNDTTAPTLFLEDVRAEASEGSAEVTYAPRAVDLVDGNVSVSCTPPSGTRFPFGDTNVQCTATDAHNNTASGGFVVHVVDTMPPIITSLTASPNILSPANHKLVDVELTADVVDANDPMPQCSVVTVTANEAINAPGSGSTDFDWLITGAMTVQLRAERSGNGSDRVYTVHVACSDASGNEAMDTTTVKVPKGNPNDSATGAPKPSKRRSVGRR
ncbi:MAG TPA: HYR domain-containing protein [Thermoanaerobaculia bacterium]|nr:HYR domain-containing protein [Thermoanaerobaculia bacterium]